MAALEAGRRAERRSRIELPISAVTTWMEQTTPLGSMEGKGHAMKALKGIAMILLALVAMALPAAAEPNDLLLTVLEDKAGELSVHYQLSADCMNLLKQFKRSMKEGSPVYLTFETGYGSRNKTVAEHFRGLRPRSALVYGFL
jgi:hypothetical protein